MRLSSGLSLAAALVTSGWLPLQGQQYTFETFSPPPPRTFEWLDVHGAGLAINNRGAIVGGARYRTQSGFKRHANGAWEFIFPPFCRDVALATGINSQGVIAGACYNAEIQKVAGWLRVEDAFSVVDASANATWVSGINNRGHLVGTLDYSRGFISIDGAVTEFNCPAPPGNWPTWPADIAWDDTVVGWCSSGGVAFLRGPRGKILRFRVAGSASTWATGINNEAGKIVGGFTEATWPHQGHGFIYSYVADLMSSGGEDAWNTAAIREVPVQVIDFPGADSTHLHGINARGVIVGITLRRPDEGSPQPDKAFIGTPVP